MPSFPHLSSHTWLQETRPVSSKQNLLKHLLQGIWPVKKQSFLIYWQMYDQTGHPDHPIVKSHKPYSHAQSFQQAF